MPAVVPVFQAAFTAVNAFAASSAVAGFLVNTVSSIAMSALATAIRGKPDQRQPGITTNTTTAGGTVPQRLIFGTYATAGQMVCPPMVYQTDGNPNEWLTYVISLADKPVTALGRIFVDGQALTIDGNPAASANGDAMGATVQATDQSNLREKIFIRFHNGRQTAADAYLRRVFATYPERPWTADMIGTGVAYAVVTFKGKAQDGDYQGFPSVKFEVDGHALYDPRDGTQNPANEATWKFTRNPAVIAYNILRGINMPGGDRWGVGATSFVLSSVIAAMNVCAEQVPTETGANRARYIAGLEVSVADEPHTALTEVVKAMGGDVADMGGTWLLQAGEPDGPVLSITDDDIIVTDSRSLRPYPGLDETYNAIHASYPDPSQQWEAKEAVPLYNAAYEAKDGGRRLIAEVDFPAVPSPRQVRALMREMLADHRRHRTHVITLPPDALGIAVGQHIAWSSVTNGYNAKLFKVMAIRVDPVSLCVALTLTERDPADYDYDAGSDGVVPTIPSVQPVAPVIAGVTGWDAFAVNAGGRPGIRMVWNPEIRARAVSWTIRRADNGSEANSGTTSDLTRGENIQTAGLLPATAYTVTGRLVIPGRGTESVTTTVTTLDIRMGLDDLADEVRDTIDEFDGFMDEVPGLIDGLRTDIDADIAAVNGRVTQARTDLGNDVASARQLALDNLNVARNYTDTSVQSEAVARQTEAGQLAARIDQITAANVSNNLLTNGDFASGTTGWTGNFTVDAERARIANGQSASQTFDVSFAVSEILQWRLLYDRTGASGGSMNARVAFMDANGAQIGSEFVTPLPYGADGARVASGQHAPPQGTARARITIDRGGSVVSLDDVAVTKIDQQTAARIQSLEVALTTDQQALVTLRNETTARFGTTDAAISNEATTRANADNSITLRTAALESTTQNHASRISSTETTVSNQVAALSQLETVTEAESGRTDVVRDGTFARGLTYWPDGDLPASGRIVARNEASSDTRIQTMPAPAAMRFTSTDAVSSWRVTGLRPVTPGEVVEVSYDAYRAGSGVVQPVVQVEILNAAKSPIQSVEFAAAVTGSAWGKQTGRLTVAAGAVYSRVSVGVKATGSQISYVTNVSALRTGAGYASSADARALSQSLADDQQALATYRTQANARFENVETGISQQANATQTLATRVGNVEGVNTNQAAALTSLNSSMYGPDGEVRAQATAVSALTTRVSDVEGGVQTIAGSVQAITARTDRTYASGLFRVSSEAAPTGAQTRIGLRAEAGTNDTSHSAGMYLEARSDGTTQAGFIASRFWIAHGPATDAPRQVPFIVDNGRVIIGEALVDTLSIRGNAVIVPVATAENNEVRLGVVGAQGTVSAAAINNPTGAPVFVLFNGQQAGAGPAICDYYIYRNSTMLRSMRHTSFDNGQQTSMVFSAVDLNPPVGPSNYTVRAAKFSQNAYVNDVVLTNRTLSLQAVQR